MAALLVAGLLTPGGTGANSAFSSAGLSELSIFYNGVCLPGDLATGESIGAGDTIDIDNQVVVELDTPGDVFGCLGTDTDPATVQINSELFDFANVAADLVTNIPSAGFTGTVTLENVMDDEDNVVQTDWDDGLFPTSGTIYIDQEEIAYDTRTATTINITTRGVNSTTAEAHDPGSFVRLQGSLKLIAREGETYADGSNVHPGAGATTAAAHAAGDAVASPTTYLTCRNLQTQTAGAGDDKVNSRSRCYTRTSPDGPWADPYPGPPLALAALVFHNISSGTIDDDNPGATTTTTLITGIGGFDCFEFVSGELWVQIVTTTTIDKDAGNKSLGEFRINVYDEDTCSSSTISVLGGADGDNLSSTPILDLNHDTDGDGCADAEELGTSADVGGLRDPYNEWDFYDTNQDKTIDLFNDIFAVAGDFGTAGSDKTDRGDLLPDGDGKDDPDSALDGPGPASWNMSPPDGTVDLFIDVFGVAGQFGHDCSASA